MLLFVTCREIISFLYQNKQVHDAGHMVPMDQPKASLQMLQRWTQGKLATTQKQERVAKI